MKTKLLILTISISLGYSNIINVPDDYPTIQQGINAATSGDTVLVATGTYIENIVWPATNGIKLIGSGVESTIIDGDGAGSVIKFGEELAGIIDTTTTIAGFTIQNGYAQGDWPSQNGGGIHCDNSSPSLYNVTITGNSAYYGGGIFCYYSSNLRLVNVTLTNNSSSYFGGGINCYVSSPSLMNVTIDSNSAISSGGGIHCFVSNPNLENVTLTGNSTSNHGGGIGCTSNSNPTLENVTITGNSASNNGGGIYCSQSNPSLQNVSITGNSGSSGGGIYCAHSSPNLENVTLTGNVASSGGGIYCQSQSSPSMQNVSITSNTASSQGGGLFCNLSSSPSFSSEDRCNVYSNHVTSRGNGADIFAYDSFVEVIIDTFTVMNPTDYYASPIDSFSFDILNSINPQIDADLYVSPDGDNSNDGLTPESPLKTIKYATSLIWADSTNPHTIYLVNGVYSSSTNGEFFPVEMINYVSY